MAAKGSAKRERAAHRIEGDELDGLKGDVVRFIVEGVFPPSRLEAEYLSRFCPGLQAFVATALVEARPPSGGASLSFCLSPESVGRGIDPANARLFVDVCAPHALTRSVECAAKVINATLDGTASVVESGSLSERVVDFGVYKRPGFDRALDAVRGLPGMRDVTAHDVAKRGASKTEGTPNAAIHPCERYNRLFVDVLPKDEAAGRDGLIATHRGTHSAFVADGRWIRLRVDLAERAAQAHGPRIGGALCALMRATEGEALARGGMPVPPAEAIPWLAHRPQ